MPLNASKAKLNKTNNTIETPSFKSDSPKMRTYIISLSFIPKLLKTLKTAIGSMEDIGAPNISDSTKGMDKHHISRAFVP